LVVPTVFSLCRRLFGVGGKAGFVALLRWGIFVGGWPPFLMNRPEIAFQVKVASWMRFVFLLAERGGAQALGMHHIPARAAGRHWAASGFCFVEGGTERRTCRSLSRFRRKTSPARCLLSNDCALAIL
jgi:hypothetical protein